MTTAQNAPATSNYAGSHAVINVSAKRFSASPWSRHYADDQTVFGVYNGRLYPLSLGADPVADYWHLRTQAGLFDVPELPIEISGPDAERFLDVVLTRDMTTVPSGRARYALACDFAGKILMDGVLIRWSDERFWYVLADGQFLPWLRSLAREFDVTISDPQVWVLQIQGPRSLEILSALTGDSCPDPFPYFAASMTAMDGQDVLVTRTGWTGELGMEIYVPPTADRDGLWEFILRIGEPLGLRLLSLECMGIRRIEAGILDNGTDMDPTLTPFDVGLGRYVDFGKPEFVGKSALLQCATETRLIGIRGAAVPRPGDVLTIDGQRAAEVRAGAWSPSLDCAVGYVLFDADVDCREGLVVTSATGDSFETVSLPFLDPERALAKGVNNT